MLALQRKYETLLLLRNAQETVGTKHRTETKQALQALAKEFPGALRELDAMPYQEIQRRIAHLQLLQTDPSALPQQWVLPMMRYHQLLRSALENKHWCNAQRLLPSRQSSSDSQRSSNETPSQNQQVAALKRHSREPLRPLTTAPAKQRLTATVLQQMAEEFSLSAEKMKEILFHYEPMTIAEQLPSSEAASERVKGS
jgi:superfamily II DNA helicase RecQ